MGRGKPCSICEHPERMAVDAGFQSGMRVKALAAQYPALSKDALTRHRRNCLGISATGSPAAEVTLEQQVAKWTERADALYLASAASLDLRGQSNAIAGAFRAMELSFRQREKQDARDSEQKEKENSIHAPVTMASLDALVRAAETHSRENPIPHLISRIEAELSLLAEHQRGAVRAGLREYLSGGVKAA